MTILTNTSVPAFLHVKCPSWSPTNNVKALKLTYTSTRSTNWWQKRLICTTCLWRCLTDIEPILSPSPHRDHLSRDFLVYCTFLTLSMQQQQQTCLMACIEVNSGEPAPDQLEIPPTVSTFVITMRLFTSYQFPQFLRSGASDERKCKHFESLSTTSFHVFLGPSPSWVPSAT